MIEQMLAWDKEVILWIHRNLHSNIGDYNDSVAS
jgi:hypothetical protein